MRAAAKIALERVEGAFDKAFGAHWNPFHQLGALGYFFYWIVAVTGIYLYIFFDTSVTAAYESIEKITVVQWYAGGVMRSLHRYASDALVIVMILHLVREYILDRFRGVRWFAWITGVPILWFVFASGISGYWLVWDKLAQYIAVKSTEWMDTLGIFGEPIARNFLNESSLADRFFTLMVFMHIAVPLFLLFVMWIHLQRNAKPRVNPPRGLAVGTLLALVGLSLAKPAISQPPANLDQVVSAVQLDWFYLVGYPLLDMVPGIWLWIGAGVGTALLVVLPWLPPKRRPAVAEVDLEFCNGCGRCVDDCPFNAVDLMPRSDGRPFSHEAVVKERLCTSCGICMAACPPSTPFRRSETLRTGIDLPDDSLEDLRRRTVSAAEGLQGEARVLVYGCQYGPDVDRLTGDGVAGVNLSCVAALPPSFLDFVLSRGLADGVVLTGCPEGDCQNRLGIDWTQQRVDGQRDPYLRKRVARDRIVQCWLGVARTGAVRREIERFRARLRTLVKPEPTEPGAGRPRTAEVAAGD